MPWAVAVFLNVSMTIAKVDNSVRFQDNVFAFGR
jgi:hypothetical protein